MLTVQSLTLCIFDSNCSGMWQLEVAPTSQPVRQNDSVLNLAVWEASGTHRSDSSRELKTSSVQFKQHGGLVKIVLMPVTHSERADSSVYSSPAGGGRGGQRRTKLQNLLVNLAQHWVQKSTCCSHSSHHTERNPGSYRWILAMDPST